MTSRPLVVLLVAVLAAGLFTPVAVSAGDSPGDTATLSTPGGADSPALDRYRPAAVASSGLSRADTDGVLDQPTRAAVYRSIRDTPGSDLVDIADRVGVTKSTVRYHVDVLRDAGLVGAAEVAGALRFAPADMDAQLAGTMAADATGEILGAVATAEPASVTTVAEETDRAISTVSYHLSTLEDRGIVERERVGESVMTTLTDDTRAALPTAAVALADD